MRKLLLAALPIALMGNGGACVTTRYHSVKCLTSEQYQRLRAAEPERVGDKLTGQAQEDYKIVAGSAVRLRTWGEGLLTVLGGCQG